MRKPGAAVSRRTSAARSAASRSRKRAISTAKGLRSTPATASNARCACSAGGKPGANRRHSRNSRSSPGLHAVNVSGFLAVTPHRGGKSALNRVRRRTRRVRGFFRSCITFGTVRRSPVPSNRLVCRSALPE